MAGLLEFAQKAGVDDIAVCDASDFPEVEALLRRDISLGILPPFTETDLKKRVSPEETLPGAKSFIVILEKYTPPAYKHCEGFGNISPAATGIDYHRTVMEKLTILTEYIEKTYKDSKCMAFVDNSPFSEKHVAIRAGLGKLMRNGLFYSRHFGSRCFIGLILTNLPADVFDIPERNDTADAFFLRCSTCKACMTFCPGKALTEKGMNSYRCVAYLTQKKEPLSESEKKAMGIQVYGCDICQKVCPLNENIPAGYETGEPVDL